MKIRKLHIDEYKMFKDFDIDFVDEHDKALPIVVLAGVNGTGKTSLLDSIFNPNFEFEIEIETNEGVQQAGNYSASFGMDRNSIDYLIEADYYYKDIEYYSMGTSLKNIKTLLPKYIENMIFVEGIAPFDSYTKVTEYINNILKNLDIKIEFDSRDGEGNLFFRNMRGEKFSIDELSTGEQTLLSKVVFLYLDDTKDKVILIDEPELSLHPSWQNKVLRIYENFALENNCQIIIATHSPHIIGSAKPEYIRVLKKVDDKIEVAKYTQSYGLEFNKVLTDIMGADTRVSEVSDRLSKIKSLIVQNEFNSEEFQEIWMELEKLIGADNIDLRLLQLEIASRKKNAQNK